jgi:hypothetical protein
VPDELRELLDRLREPLPEGGALPQTGPGVPAPPSDLPQELLDYLLAP